MNIIEDFKAYYTNWCKEHGRPQKDSEIINKDWKLAWSEFLEKSLIPRLKEVQEEYLEMELLTKRAQQNRTSITPELDTDDSVDSGSDDTPLSDWDVVVGILKNE